MKDALLKVLKYLPAAGANNTTDAIDLEADSSAVARGERAPVRHLLVSVPALPANTDNTKTITIDLYDSADGVTFAQVQPLIECQVPGVAVTGSLATDFRFPLPAVRRYIALKSTVPAGAGDNTGVQITAELEF